MIVQDINNVRYWCNGPIVATSGGFDPVHVGHVRCILESSKLAQRKEGTLVVIVNGDGFLERKKGFSFMTIQERMEIVNAIVRPEDIVTCWNGEDQYIAGALEAIGPKYFMKGGDRSTIESIPNSERAICSILGCQIIFGVGGVEKIQSSSELTNKVKQTKS